MTTRRLEPSGFTEKTRELDDLKTGEVTRWRERWATLVNEHLEEHGHKERVDHRSLEAQGEVREPGWHKGPAVTAIERRGEVAHVTYRHQDEAARRLEIAVELGRLERESRALARSIIDTTADLEATIAARDAERTASPREPAHEPKPSMPDLRRDAQTQWLAQIAEQGRAERQATQAHRTSVIDLTGNVASATASRTTTAETTTREQAQASWRTHRAEHSTGRDNEREAGAPDRGRARVAQADDDLAK
jgi:hypothetical protein